VLIHTALKKNWRMSVGEKRRPVEVEGSEGAEKRRKEENVTVTVRDANFPTDVMSWIVGKVRESARNIEFGSAEVRGVEIDKLLRSCFAKYHGVWEVEFTEKMNSSYSSKITGVNCGMHSMTLGFNETPTIAHTTILKITNFKATPWPKGYIPEDSDDEG
jgi:hypothetical protein